jgi:P27 family predicted phage terminase small subunit
MPNPKRKSGKRKTPTVIAESKGIGQTHKKNKNEPVPTNAEVKMPQGLTSRAQTKWKNLAPLLIEMGTLTAVDVDSFVIYCEAWSAYSYALRKVDKQGYVIEKKGVPTHRNPYVDIMNQAKKDMERYSTIFGLSASDRAGIELEQKTKEKNNPFAQLKKG